MEPNRPLRIDLKYALSLDPPIEVGLCEILPGHPGESGSMRPPTVFDRLRKLKQEDRAGVRGQAVGKRLAKPMRSAGRKHCST